MSDNFYRAIKYTGLILFSAVAMLLSFFIAYYITHEDITLSSLHLISFFKEMKTLYLINLVLLVCLLAVLGLLFCDLRRVSVVELVKLLFISLVLFFVCFIYEKVGKPIGWINIDVRWCISYTTCLVIFLSLGFFSKRLFRYHKFIFGRNKNEIRTMVVGAGAAGCMLIKEIRSTDKITIKPICFIDDDKAKRGLTIEGVKVVGDTSEIKEKAEKYKIQMIVIALPSLPKKVVAPIYEKCLETKCKVKQVPGLYQFLNGKVALSQMQEVDIRDLLGREQIICNEEQIASYVQNKVVLVTGGGGSIGSELCRQLANFKIKELIVFDIAELGAYNLQQELLRKHPNLNLKVLIGSVRDLGKLEQIFETYKPQVVFHAAAHKHVPLMEYSPHEAVKNNVFGTYNTAITADKYGVERFLLISTDKAVNPTNVMGATKRICEMIVQALNRKSKTEFVAVRFGNVLGSSGSVIPLFKSQIASGGPVTVTSKEITRYFMTIPEAVSLVLQAGVYAKGGEIFVLDMGEPVRIYDMAENLIRLSGFEPHKDIKIEVTGLRPGEKLYEERLMDEEGLDRTENELISIGKPLVFDEDNFFIQLSKLKEIAYDEKKEIKQEVAKIVTTYKYNLIDFKE